jgi:hypothetical protein
VRHIFAFTQRQSAECWQIISWSHKPRTDKVPDNQNGKIEDMLKK